ncbi:GNAT family N-acetyltransferase [Streptomyces sp. AN091965]|uniref:GNAT family N-acetyltransferase n=1 Tax=Streptomyces sp. AN091965 TaxID=2927803 RepID=UPI001F6209BA|nr:GNAT family N-acetyltransferase [Streptomyces sp. AN091965]MCI3930705.1 GNAT family N-acetyltransferase [Streptomyces sp. AN091965]
MTADLRELSQRDWDRWYGTLERAFGGLHEAPEERELWDDLTEYDRSLGLWDGEECVGTAGAFSFRMTVPGGALVDAAGVTMVSVAATHRRRGLLTSMMRRQLDDLRERGEALAVLTASEPAIYGRFGYGAATWLFNVSIDTARVRLTVPAGTDEVRLRYAVPAEAAAACEAVYARVVPGRPGMLARQPGWERLPLLDPERDRDGASPLQCVLAERGGEVVGYAYFAVTSGWEVQGPKGVVRVRAVEALDPAAHAALWRFLCDIDLTSRVESLNVPVDDPLLHLVSDVRRCGLVMRDSLHVRPVEVGAALEARTYRAPVDVVLDVTDAFCPWNEGRWRLTGDPKGASCKRADDDAPADLALSVREVGSAYLGGVSLAELARAGRVRELRPGALAEASLAFGSEVAPWLPHGF